MFAKKKTGRIYKMKEASIEMINKIDKNKVRLKDMLVFS